jgi:hypothetical protein
MSQKCRGPGVPRADEVPFGIRALERGVEVEGVWHSRGNTPEPSIRNESRASSIWDFMPKRATVHDVEKQEQVRQEQAHQERDHPLAPKHRHVSLDSIMSVPKPASRSLHRSASAENLSKSPATRDGASRPTPTKPVRSKHPPPSFAKYSGYPSLHRQSSTARTFEGIEALYRASTYLDPGTRHGESSSESYTQSSSGSGTDDSGPISSAAPRLFTQKTQARPRHHSVDFELLNSHRQSQAAETGQLTPKTRKPTSSVDLSGVASSSSRDLGYFALKADGKISLTPPLPRDNPSPPKVDALPAAVRRSSIPDVTPFTQFVQTAPAMPRSASLQFPVAEGGKSPEAASPKPSILSPPINSIAPQLPAAKKNVHAEQATPGAVRPSFEKERRASQVLRGHGTGFEILQPGSLPAMIPALLPPPEKSHAVPPVALQNYTRARSRSSSRGSTGRKLQKKRRGLSVDL